MKTAQGSCGQLERAMNMELEPLESQLFPLLTVSKYEDKTGEENGNTGGYQLLIYWYVLNPCLCFCSSAFASLSLHLLFIFKNQPCLQNSRGNKKDLCIQRDICFTYRFQKPFGIFFNINELCTDKLLLQFFFFKPVSYCNFKNNLSCFAFILRLIFALLFHQEKLDSNNF